MTTLEITHVLLFLVLVFLLYLMSNCGCSGNGFNVGGQDDSCLDKIDGLDKVCCGIRPSNGEGGDVNNCEKGYPYVCEGDCPLAIESARETCANDKNIDEPDRKLIIDNLNNGCKGVPNSNDPWPLVPTDDEMRIWGDLNNYIDFESYIGYENFHIIFGEDYSTKSFYEALPSDGVVGGKTKYNPKSSWSLFNDLACFGVGDIQLNYVEETSEIEGNYDLIIPVHLREGNLFKSGEGPIRNLTIDITLGVYETLDDIINKKFCKTINTSKNYIEAIREEYIGSDLDGFTIGADPKLPGTNCKYITIKDIKFNVHYFY
jgi:hypothetical protein